MGNQLTVVETDAVVVSMNRARLALAEAQTIQQTKKILDVAAAAEIYAKRQKLGEEASDLALSIKVEALRKLGEMLQAQPKAQGTKGRIARTDHGGYEVEPPSNDAPTLAELGLSKKESAVAQKLADLPDDEFEKVRDGHVTVAKAIAAVDQQKKTAAKPKRSLAGEAPPEVADYDPRDDELSEARTTIAELADENAKLKDRIAVEAWDAPEEEKLSATGTIEKLRAEVKTLTVTLAAVTASRDRFQNENAQMKRQMARQRRDIERLQRAREAA